MMFVSLCGGKTINYFAEKMLQFKLDNERVVNNEELAKF